MRSSQPYRAPASRGDVEDGPTVLRGVRRRGEEFPLVGRERQAGRRDGRHPDDSAHPLRRDGQRPLSDGAAHRMADQREPLPAEPVGQRDHVRGALGRRVRTARVLGLAVSPEVHDRVLERTEVEVCHHRVVRGAVGQPAVYRDHLVRAVAVQSMRQNRQCGHADSRHRTDRTGRSPARPRPRWRQPRFRARPHASASRCWASSWMSGRPAGAPRRVRTGSGSAGLLEVALELAKTHRTPANKVRFAWWSAEENGLKGSEAYVAKLDPAQQKQIALPQLRHDRLAERRPVRLRR